MKKMLVLLLMTCLTGASWAEGDRDKLMSRVDSAGTILSEIMSAPDRGIPDEILGSAKCVAIIPSMLKGGFVFGARYGQGVASCRTATGWSAPAFFSIKGGSFGFQIGAQAVDLVMLVMNEHGMRSLLSSKFELGADASAAAGPVGRHAEGGTDWKMRAEILTYSRARGAFAGVTLNGALVKQNKDDTRTYYGRMVPFRTLLMGQMAAPPDAQGFLASLSKYAPVDTANPPKPVAQAQPAPDGSSEPAARLSDSQPGGEVSSANSGQEAKN